MTVDQVKELVRSQAEDDLETTNDHRISLKQALVPPRKIRIAERIIREGKIKDRELDAWLVAQEDSPDGYRIVLRDDAPQFGLASKGFPSDRFLILAGWYGSLKSAFLSV